MKVGILTGGGDCPGLNAVIRGVVTQGAQFGYEFVGIRDGWKGLVESITMELTTKEVSGILPLGGTILGTSRTNPFKHEGDVEKVISNLKALSIDALVCIGGDDTLGVASKLFDRGIKTVGVPKTIDNDLSGTDTTFGFDTAVSIVSEALDRLHTTAESHHRAMVVEVMGRNAGWIALHGGLAGSADVILIPEVPFDMDEVCAHVNKESREKAGKTSSLIVVAEGATPRGADGVVTQQKGVDAFGHVRLGGIGEYVAGQVEEKTGIETRSVVLGHLQRGGTPTAYDRVLATRYGVKAIEMVKDGSFGNMAALQGGEIVEVSLHVATGTNKTVDMELFKVAEVFFG